MPDFPEQLYSDPYIVGRAGPAIELVYRKLDTSASAATSYLYDLYTVPKDKVLLINSSHVELGFNAAMSAARARLVIKLEGQNTPRFEICSKYQLNSGGDGDKIEAWQYGVIYAPPSCTIQYSATWSGSDSPVVVGCLTGLLIPRANIAPTG